MFGLFKRKKGRRYYNRQRSFLRRRTSFRDPGVYISTPKQKSFFTLPLRTILLVTLTVLVGGLLLFIFFSPVFVIRNIVVLGNHHLTSSEVRETTDTVLRENSSLILPVGHIFFLNKDDLTYDLKEKLPLVESVKFDRNFPDTLKVRIRERTPAFIWKAGEDFYYIDPNGYAYLKLNSQEAESSNLIILQDQAKIKVEIGQKVVTASFVDFINELLVSFTPKTKVQIGKIILPLTTMEIRVLTKEGWQAYFDTTRPANTQLKHLVSALKQVTKPRDQLEYIDLRLKDRIFYR
jgi:cell division septal protein FtsQ